MSKSILIILLFANYWYSIGQSGPVLTIQYGNSLFGVESIEPDSSSLSFLSSRRTVSNNSVIEKSLQVSDNMIQANYNFQNIQDSVRSIKSDGSFIYVCYPTRIIKISDTPIPVAIWTYSVSQISMAVAPTPSTNSSPRFMNMELRHDTLFTLFNDGVIRPLLLNKNSGSFIPNYNFNNTSVFVTLSNAPCLKTVDMKLIGNQLFIYGTIQTSLNHYGIKLFSFDLNTGNLNSSYPLFYSYTATNSGFVNDIVLYNKKIYVGGSFGFVDGNVRKSFAVFDENFNLLGDNIPFTVFNTTTEMQGIRRLQVYGNLLVTLGVYHSINSIPVTSPSTPKFCLNYYNLNTNGLLSTSTSSLVDQIPVCSKVELKVSNLYLIYASYFNSNSNNSNILHLPPMTYGNHILYPGSNSLSTYSFFTMCAPDNGTTTFTAPIKYHCNAGIPSNLINNTWSYSGTGVTIVPLMNGTQAKLILAPGATGGQLSVYGTNSEGLISETMKLNIYISQKPTVTSSFVNSDSISCKRPKIPITFSMNPVSMFTPTWTCPDNTYKYNVNDSTKKYLPGYYKITVKSNSGCYNSDSIYAKLDTLKPNITLPTNQVFIKCVPDSSLLQGSTTSTGSAIWWRNALNSNIKYQPNYVKTIGNYYMVVKTFQNGCKDSSLYQVKDQTSPPNAKLISHNYINPLIAVDTITCFNPSVTLSGGSDTTNTIIQWRNITAPTFSADPISVNSQGNYKLYVTRNDNGCADSSKIILVAQNNSIPNLTILNPNQTLNCSYSNATLSAIVNNTNTILNWITPSTSTLTNPSIVNVTGKYYLQAIDTTNGCTKKDSLDLIQTNALIVNAGNDQLVCKNTLVNLSAITIGTLSNISYSWGQSGTGHNITVSTSSTTNFIVTAVGGNNCIGTDTIKVIIPTDIKDSLVTFQNCDNTPFGSIIAYASGGITPYKYSINNGITFSTINTFTNLPFGNYTVLIKDSLGCLRSGNTSLNGNSNLPTPKFIASTFNYKRDTIVLVDLSNPRPDSVQWTLPPQMNIVGGSMFSPLVHINDTGNFMIIMKSFYGTCMLSTSKMIRFSESDTIHATATNANGIKSIILYPNPNSGSFTVNVEFFKKQNASIQVWDATPYKHYQQNFQETAIISLPVNLAQLNNGTYILRVIGEFDSRNITFIISK